MAGCAPCDPQCAGLETLRANRSPISVFCLFFFFFHALASVVGKAPPSTTAGSQSPPETPLLTRSSSQTPTAGVTATTSTTSTVTAPAAAAAAPTAAATTTGSPVKKQRPLLPKETAPAVQRVVWNSSSKFQTSSQKWHMQKIQRQQQSQQQSQQPQSSQGTRYQTRQAVKGTAPPSVPRGARSLLATSTGATELFSFFFFFAFFFSSFLFRGRHILKALHIPCGIIFKNCFATRFFTFIIIFYPPPLLETIHA